MNLEQRLLPLVLYQVYKQHENILINAVQFNNFSFLFSLESVLLLPVSNTINIIEIWYFFIRESSILFFN